MTDCFVKSVLLAKHTDLYNYTTYAFRNLDTKEYILCTRFPNWEHKKINIGDEGILHFREVIGGEDAWYNGTSFTKYKYTGWHFIQFVPLDDDDNELIMNQMILKIADGMNKVYKIFRL